MKRRKQLAMYIGSILVLVSLVGMKVMKQAEYKQNKVFKLAEVHGADYPTSIANERFADLVRKKTNGRIQIEVYTEGSLGEETEVIKQMQQGKIAFGRVSVGPLAEYVDRFHTLMLPYLYKNSEHMWKVLDSTLGEEMLAGLKDADLVGLAWYDSGGRSFYLNQRIEDMSALQNKKIRVQKNSLMYALCEALGAVPQSFSESEISKAVGEGLLDGAENNIPTYETYEQYKVCPYYILDEHTRIPDLLVASHKIMTSLSKEDRHIILEAAREAGLYERVLWNEREASAILSLEEKGVEFMQLSEEMKAELKVASQSLYDTFGSDCKEIIAQIEKLK